MAKARAKKQKANAHEPIPAVDASPSAGDKLGLAWSLLLPLSLVAVCVAVYTNSFEGVFIFDDEVHINGSRTIRQLWPLSESLHGRRPIIHFSLAANFAINELKVGGYHFFNVTVHALAGLTLFGVIRRTLTGASHAIRDDRRAAWIAFAVAAIWIAHPLQTQSVTYIIQRCESLMGLFYLLMLYCVIRGARSNVALLWYAAAFVSCGLGMGSKATMVTAPVMVLIYDRVFLAASWRDVLRRRWPLYAALLATLLVLVGTGVVRGVFRTDAKVASVGFSVDGMSSLSYLLTQPGVLVHYLRLSLWPAPLCLDHDWPKVASAMGTLLPALLIVPMLIGAVVALKRKPWLGFLGVWFFLILAPTSSVIPLRDPLFEHRMYLPLAALVMLAVLGVDAALRRATRRYAWSDGLKMVTAMATVAVVVGALGFTTVKRNRVYRSATTMWEDVSNQYPQSSRAQLNLGKALGEDGHFDEAIVHFEEALRLRPVFALAQYGVGCAYSEKGRRREAAAAFRAAIKIKPRFPQALYNLGNALVRDGQVEEAIEVYDRAARQDPVDQEIWIMFGNALAKIGRPDDAAEKFRRAINVEPRYADPEFVGQAYYNLGNTLASQGELADALDAYRSAARVRPNYANAFFGLGWALSQQGKHEAAAQAYRRAIQIDPHHAAAQRGLEGSLRSLNSVAPG